MTYQTAANPNLQVVLAWLQPALLAVVGIITAWGIGLAKSRGERVEKATKENAAKQIEILSVTHDVHTLVNSQYGIALALINTQARARLADAKLIAALNSDQAKKEQYEQDILLAKLNVEDSEKKLADHEAKQHVVDKREEQQQQQPLDKKDPSG
jgi:hypothetical protein